MEFCEKCNSVMVAKAEKDKVVLVCRKCGCRSEKYKPLEITENVKKRPSDEVIILEKNEEALPKTKTICPKCQHIEAVWWIQQTRSIDEAPTLFLRCVKCKHSWREYG